MVDLKCTPEIEILAAGDVPRRRHWSDANKLQVVKESYLEHRQVTATARRHGISRSLLTTWRLQYRNGKLGLETVPAFVPLTLAPESSDPPPRAAAKDVQLEIVLRNGRRLIVSPAVDPDALARLLPVLEGR
ncbi:transposase [Salipiger sp. PrR007]|uniref:IS66-like element accessory protein TnpA n=1 Tax=Salipiger sp. PrR007 TaxID=2706884 RepID=UPI0013BB8B8C|nr:transposase [Salipiger sp. PrR007]NDW32751.1 transposase [Salipiger sp. PrR007]